MFHATIRSDAQEAFRVSGEASPYNLQLLRDHVLARRRPGTRVEIRTPPPLHGAIRRALRNLDRRGVVLVLEA
jgi:hypothetical protein